MWNSYYHPHFRDDGKKLRQLEPSMLPKVTQLGRGKAAIAANVFLMSLPCSLKFLMSPFEIA